MFESPVPGIIQQNLEASFGEKPTDDDADNFLSSLEPLPGILAPVARSDLTEYEDDYLEEPQGPSYAYGALGSRFQTDAVVVDIYSNFPEPKQTSYN